MEIRFISVIDEGLTIAVRQESKSSVIPVILALIEEFGFNMKTKSEEGYIDNIAIVERPAINNSIDKLTLHLDDLKSVDMIVDMTSYSATNNVIEVTRSPNDKSLLDEEIKRHEERLDELMNPSDDIRSERFIEKYVNLSNDEKNKLQAHIIDKLIGGEF